MIHGKVKVLAPVLQRYCGTIATVNVLMTRFDKGRIVATESGETLVSSYQSFWSKNYRFLLCTIEPGIHPLKYHLWLQNYNLIS